MLRAKNKLTVENMLAIQKDVYSAFDMFLARQIVTAFNRKRGGGKASGNDLTSQAISVLRTWNGQMDKDHPEPLVTELMLRETGEALMQAAGISRSAIDAHPDVRVKPQVIETLLRERPAGWVKNDDWDGWLLENLRRALEDASESSR